MNCDRIADAKPRISGRRGQLIDLNIDFIRNGVATDPYAIRYVEIYKTQVLPHNLIATIPVIDPCDPSYPTPLCREYAPSEPGPCCTVPTEGTVAIPGR